MSSGSGNRPVAARRVAATLALWSLVAGGLPLGAGAAEPEEAVAARPYLLRVEGNRALGEAELKDAAARELDDFGRLGQRRADADDAAFQMELAYRLAGYAFARVDYRVETAADRPVLSFSVSEGPRVTVRGVEIRGNEAFGSDELGRFFEGERTGLLGSGRMLFVESQLRAAASGIRDFYYQSGFLDVEVRGPEFSFSADRSSALVSVDVREGVRYVIRAVRFEGDVPEAARGELDASAGDLVGKPYFGRRKLAIQSRVVEVYGNLGYPDARVRVEAGEGAAPGDVLLRAVVASGPLVRVSGISVSGNRKTRGAFVRNRVRFEPGDRYSLEGERGSFRDLYRAGLFSKVELTLVETEDPNSRLLQVAVEEVPSQELYLEPGWGSYELARLRAGYRERNLLGTGRVARLEGGASVKSLEAVVGLTDPWFLRTEVSADFPLYYRQRQEPSFTREEKGFSLLFSRKLTERATVTLGYDYRVTAITDVQVDEDLRDLETGYNLGSVKLQATYDTRDDYFFPTAGQKSFLAGQAAETYLGSEVTFLRFSVGTRWFVPLTSSTVLGLRYDSGLLLPTGGQVSAPLGERFFNGGENTVRSFRESEVGPEGASGEPVGGHGFNVLSLELRQRLYGNLAGTLFWDYGNIAPNRSRAEQELGPYENASQVISDTLDDFFSDLRPGVGAGVQYLLPVGPLRLDVALNPAPRSGEDRLVFHFSVGMAF